MKIRHVFMTPDLPAARRAIAVARGAGVADEDISLVARSDIEMESVPVERLEASADTLPAALRGAGVGGVVALVAGLVATGMPAIGMTFAGVSLLTLIGVMVGGWSAALGGSSYPNPVRRRFDAEIKAGRILVVIDDARDHAPAVTDALAHAGAQQLPFEESAMLI